MCLECLRVERSSDLPYGRHLASQSNFLNTGQPFMQSSPTSSHFLIPRNSSENLVLNFDNLGDYVEKRNYFGCIVGRYANRIASMLLFRSASLSLFRSMYLIDTVSLEPSQPNSTQTQLSFHPCPSRRTMAIFSPFKQKNNGKGHIVIKGQLNHHPSPP